MARSRTTYTAEYKLAAVKMITEQKLSVAEVGRRLDVSETLLKLQEGLGDIFLVCDGDVAPHRVRARGDAGHLTKGTAARFEQRRLRT